MKRIPFGPSATQVIRSALLTLLNTALSGGVIAQVSFTRIIEGDIAKDAGLSYGCAWGDYDNDGYEDLVVVDSWRAVNRLYHNNGNGTFSRVVEGTIAKDRGDSAAAVWGDYDNDGDLDLFVTNYNPPRDFFYRNEGDGHFTRLTNGAWVMDSGAGIGAAWADYDNDGFLDLYVANNERQNNFLYRNNGDGAMSKILTDPVARSGGYSHGCTWADYDGDGDADLFVAGGNVNEDQQFQNDGDGTFTQVKVGHFVNSGGANHVAIACADYDNDGDLDLLVTGNGSNPNRLYRNDGAGVLTPVEVSGLQNGQSWSNAWGDYDNDGYLDFFVSNYDWRSDRAQANFLFHNNGDGTFAQVTEGPPVQDIARSCGCAWADYDNDGDLDLFVANGLDNTTGTRPPEPGALYRNDGGTNSWIVLRLVGTASNRSAIGAKVRVLATIRGQTFWQLREISGGSGLCSQNDLRAHFGLGDATTVEKVRIEWPSGIVQELTDVAARQFLTVTEHQQGATLTPSLMASRAEGGMVQLNLAGPTNLLYVIEASTNLVQWTKIAVRTNLTGTVQFTDRATNSFRQRFYRTVTP